MKSFRTILAQLPQPLRIQADSRICFLGSCFAEHIYKKKKACRFHVFSNPFGILYNPVSIAKALEIIYQKESISAESLTLKDEVWSHWNVHSQYSGTNKEQTIARINTQTLQAHTFLAQCDVVFISLGSAYVHVLNATQDIVANCHKYPASTFTKKILSVEEVQVAIKKIVSTVQRMRPEAQCVFTISPVRHMRDGIVENNRSKAHLLTAVHHLVETENQVHYFPSYELMMDDLRDYRFYAHDMLHPSDEAVDYIWEYYQMMYMDEQTRDMVDHICKLNKATAHRPIYEDSKNHQLFLQSTAEKERKLRSRYPELDW